MESIFLGVLNMSITASAAILLVLIARLALRRVPRAYSYALWSVVLFRLLCPFSFSSVLSLLPVNAKPIPQEIGMMPSPRIDLGVPPIDRPVNALLPPAAPVASVNPLQVWITIGTLLWIAGILLLLAGSVVSLLRLRRRLRAAVWEEGNVWAMPGLETPFVMGVFRPQIYLPEGLAGEEKRYILLHEETHIRRGDHLVRLLAFLALCLHWFNPLVWLSFSLVVRDMEMSCDERVIRQLGDGVKRDYSGSLLSLATGRKLFGGTPLAFGEGDTGARIKNVLRYQKPALWAVAVAAVAVAAICVGLAMNPKRERFAMQPDEIARQFSSVWQERWATVEGHDGMLLGQGKAFLADITGDSIPELFFLYDNYKISGVVVYDIHESKIRELGSFNASSFFVAEPLRFAFYQGQGSPLVHTESTLYGPAADPQNSVTDVFSIYQNGTLQIVEPMPHRREYSDGRAGPIYYASPYDSTEISRGQYERQIQGIIGNRIVSETILLPAESPVVEFLQGGALEAYIEALLKTGNAATGAQSEKPGEQPGAEGTPSRALKDFTIAESPITLHDGTRATLSLVITEGQIIDGEEAGLGGGLVPGENYTGHGALRLTASGSVRSSLPLTEEEQTAGGLLFSHRNFPIHFGDYNDDGNPDFSIGQWGSSSVNLFSLFTIDEAGEIQRISDPLRIASSEGKGREDYSVLFPAENGVILTQYYNNAVGETQPIQFVWDEARGKFDGQEDPLAAERQFIQELLSSCKVEAGVVSLAVPPDLPDSYGLSLHVSGLMPVGDGSHLSLHAFEQEEADRSWQAGRTYRERLFDENPPDGTELSFYAGFIDAEGTVVIWDTLSLTYQNGTPQVSSSPLDTTAAVQNGEAGRTLITYANPAGGQFTVSLTLPRGWTAAPVQPGEPQYAAMLLAPVNLYADGRCVGTIGCHDFEYYPEARGENFRVSVYNAIMLGSVVSWDDSYTPVKTSENAETATCRVRYQTGGAGGTTEYNDGILSYDIGLLQYIAIELEQGAVDAGQLLQIAESVELSR